MDPRKLFVTPFENGVELYEYLLRRIAIPHSDNNSGKTVYATYAFDVY